MVPPHFGAGCRRFKSSRPDQPSLAAKRRAEVAGLKPVAKAGIIVCALSKLRLGGPVFVRDEVENEDCRGGSSRRSLDKDGSPKDEAGLIQIGSHLLLHFLCCEPELPCQRLPSPQDLLCVQEKLLFSLYNGSL
jgi:hypothetical protein